MVLALISFFFRRDEGFLRLPHIFVGLLQTPAPALVTPLALQRTRCVSVGGSWAQEEGAYSGWTVQSLLEVAMTLLNYRKRDGRM